MLVAKIMNVFSGENVWWQCKRAMSDKLHLLSYIDSYIIPFDQQKYLMTNNKYYIDKGYENNS